MPTETAAADHSASRGHRHWMAHALALAERGRYTTSPNPRVGCVLVRDGEIVGEGFHARAGGPHAEVRALEQAGERAHGATAYVTLEPCSHVGRTPACAPQLVEAGVARVVTAMNDPNPLVAGRGHKLLREAGVEVTEAIAPAAARALNPGFVSRMERGRPWVTVKVAQSLDGRSALASGESQWITGTAARRDVQFLRARQCAVLSGIDTVLTDSARLNVRLSADELGIEGEVRQPARVVLDSGLRLPPFAAIFDAPGPVWIYTRDATDGVHHEALVKRETTLIEAPAAPGLGLELEFILADLAAREVNEVLVEAGAKLAGAFVAAGLCDELVVYQAPVLLGHQARPALALPEPGALADAARWTLVDETRLGDDLRLTLRPAR
ncbi:MULTISPECIES: bifunctional diaminohydroxyphosphoribosylaminopyrimidine deaminase/5-amino-6-(5-phosphoribosylamino)uracil reductase RibD [unclassified Guyparkeria]|uniref:bifunctional diaminohydroxyphosphoribosylaminopyrimidine deaminase/5-amino-6-(5-phosphoribosylamino)uracil reductase RibD n=1 Tax=unclassified Guyparkeria TaxID=2626246 RepID=UPI000733401E|nr:MULTISPECIES: bifunctional diaminohydroxyphosphoribosylaminopyrimidine deaminase/5-amino-6-(5-phosphoribosylamino)uracil reductase RibD [unclassified Guyparkeria]KTG16376.1 bifunctional diaminohydroxyphosphoribosylaminopyrimidine deaminase/5-amino-6-(5-phosphoribosylamino)uracil reductase [Guyparkeria sp. XI15]OAE85316.1 bifunctional diaminohydroxyphosphoribosylaminopyrimidine deaminase/5-amino-6-(5-phosphoribosylamino)uracil reductase [Guyparkeria sp. WRN-7]